MGYEVVSVVSNNGAKFELSKFRRVRTALGDEETWIKCWVDLRVGVFEAAYEASFIEAQLINFAEDLLKLDKGTTREVVFDPAEPWLSFKIKRQSLGGLRFCGTARSLDVPGVELAFSFDADASQASEISRSISRTLSEVCN